MKNTLLIAGVLTSLAAAFTGALVFTYLDQQDPDEDKPASRHLSQYQIQVNEDGSFTPDHLSVKSGQTVEWLLPNRQMAVVAATGPGAAGSCPTPAPEILGDDNNLTGPSVHQASGIFTLNTRGPGLVEERVGPSGRCSNGDVNPYVIGDTTVCKVGEDNATMEQTWADPTLAGAFIRLDWRDVQKGPGLADENFDFTALDRELQAAVEHGKLVTLNFVAGGNGTPEWLFTQGGVEPLHFQDKAAGSSGDSPEDKSECGVSMTLGDPTDEAYQEHYFELLRKVGEHIRTRSDWYRAVAYVKLSGANLLTEENALPSRCVEGCICNTEVWAKAGYTPEGLQQFFARQMDVWQQEFPGKPMIYALIQDGWPRVSNDGAYLTQGKNTSGGKVPGPFDQTEAILALGDELYGDLFVTAHNGLQPQSEGRPNPWVVEVQDQGRPTSYQTTNLKKVADRTDLQGVMNLLWEDTNAFYLEIYEQVAWDARQHDGILAPESKTQAANTVSEWDALLQDRRNDSAFADTPIYPDSYSYTFDAEAGDEFYFYNPAACAGDARQKYGVIEIVP